MNDQLKRLCRDGKYTKWLCDFRDDQIAGLLWLVGEFQARANPADYDPEDVSYPGERRKVGALRAIARFATNPMTLDETRQHIRGCVHSSDAAFLRKVANSASANWTRAAEARILRIANHLDDDDGHLDPLDAADGEPEGPQGDYVEGYAAMHRLLRRIWHRLDGKACSSTPLTDAEQATLADIEIQMKWTSGGQR